MPSRRVVALTTSPLPTKGQITDGPGFRMWTVLQEIARLHRVHVLSLYESYHEGRRGSPAIAETDGILVEAQSHSPGRIQRRIRELAPDVLYLPWNCAFFLGSSNRATPTILDYVGPALLEEFASRGRVPVHLADLFADSFGCGDLFVTTTVRERFYLIGSMAATGYLSRTDTSAQDPLVAVVRMTPPSRRVALPTRPPGPSTGLSVLLAGAFLPWYDFQLVVDAVDAVPEEVARQLRVTVLGGNPRRPDVEASVRARLTSGRHADCFRLVGVVPFEDRLTYYAEADVGLALGAASVENELSARTRVVDYLGSGLPLLSPAEDEYSSEIVAAGGGFRYSSAAELSDRLSGLARDPTPLARARERLGVLLDGPFNASAAARPILEFLDSPRRRPRLRSGRDLIRRVGLFARDFSAGIRNR